MLSREGQKSSTTVSNVINKVLLQVHYTIVDLNPEWDEIIYIPGKIFRLLVTVPY